MSAVETLIVYEDLDVTRHTLRNAAGEQIVVHTRPPPILSAATAGAAEKGAVAGIAALSEEDRAKFIDKSTGLEMEQAAEPVSLLEWFAEKHNEYGAALEFVTNRACSLSHGSADVAGSQEGNQFERSFGGVGAILRYKVRPHVC